MKKVGVSHSNAPKSLILSCRVYRILLHTYPATFRREYGPDMAQVFQDKCRAELAGGGASGLLRLWLLILSDWGRTAFEQHIQEVFDMSGRQWFTRLGALAALAGGLLSLYLLMQAPNFYGNYGWNGRLAPLAAFLFAVGLGGAIAAYPKAFNTLGWLGVVITMTGLILMGLGYAIESLWPFIFFGPLIIVPVGSIMLGFNIYRSASLPTWWRLFPFVVGVIAILGFGVELSEEFIGNTSPDRGLQLAEALFSIAWIGLGIGLWLNYGNLPDDPQLAD